MDLAQQLAVEMLSSPDRHKDAATFSSLPAPNDETCTYSQVGIGSYTQVGMFGQRRATRGGRRKQRVPRSVRPGVEPITPPKASDSISQTCPVKEELNASFNMADVGKFSFQSRRSTYSSEKTIICDYEGCGKRFFERKNMLRHQTIKHNRAVKFRRRGPNQEGFLTLPAGITLSVTPDDQEGLHTMEGASSLTVSPSQDGLHTMAGGITVTDSASPNQEGLHTMPHVPGGITSTPNLSPSQGELHTTPGGITHDVSLNQEELHTTPGGITHDVSLDQEELHTIPGGITNVVSLKKEELHTTPGRVTVSGSSNQEEVHTI